MRVNIINNDKLSLVPVKLLDYIQRHVWYIKTKTENILNSTDFTFRTARNWEMMYKVMLAISNVLDSANSYATYDSDISYMTNLIKCIENYGYTHITYEKEEIDKDLLNLLPNKTDILSYENLTYLIDEIQYKYIRAKDILVKLNKLINEK